MNIFEYCIRKWKGSVYHKLTPQRIKNLQLLGYVYSNLNFRLY